MTLDRKTLKKILIALPCYRTMEAESVNSLCQVLTWSHQHLPGYTVELKMAARQQVVVARSGLAQYALDNCFDYILYIDDDHIWPPDVIHRLLSHNVRAVSALYYRRMPPYGPVAFKGVTISNGDVLYERLRGDETGLLSIDAVGMGCFLLDVEVLKQMSQPFFVMEGREGSDIHFSRRIRDLNIPIYLDADLVVGHLGDRPNVGRELWSLSREDSRVSAALSGGSDVTVPSSALHLDYEQQLTIPDKIERLKLRLSIDPSSPGAYRELGVLFKDSNRPKEAVQAFQTCIAFAREAGDTPQIVSAQFYLGTLYQQQNEIANAKQAFRQCLELEPNHRKAAELFAELEN